MNAKDLQAELEESLLQGLALWKAIPEAERSASLEDLMRERAKNIASWLAARCVPDATSDEALVENFQSAAKALKETL